MNHEMPKRDVQDSQVYWYERDLQLFQREKLAMVKYFPTFTLGKLDDGRLCWDGWLNPRGVAGGRWHLMVVYQHNHPDYGSCGPPIRVYSIEPDLHELKRRAGRLPHVGYDNNGNIYIDLAMDPSQSLSAPTALGKAAQWIFVVEGWLDGNIGEEVFL